MDVYSSDLGHIKGFDKSVFERIYKGINMETFLNHIGNDLEEKLYMYLFTLHQLKVNK